MPIYEFYCPACHRIFSFLSRSVDTRKRPPCPRCSRTALDRRVSVFAISKGRAEPGGEDTDLSETDEARMEQAMAGLAAEADGINEDDPRSMARLMHRFFERTGMPVTAGMQEALSRMEAGEDPDKIEEELGDVLDLDDPFSGDPAERLGNLRKRLRPPVVDDQLYEL